MQKKAKAEEKPKEFPVVMRLRETPVPMPNTTVKTQAADDTWLETARESKWLPESIFKIRFYFKTAGRIDICRGEERGAKIERFIAEISSYQIKEQ